MNENEKGPAVIEIQTIEGGRLAWIAIYSDSDRRRAIRWGEDLLHGVTPKPYLRVTAGLHGRGRPMVTRCPLMSESVDRVTEIAGRVAAASGGPWSVTESSHFVSRGTEIPDFRIEGPEADMEGESVRADAEFIAHAREDIPYLLERLRTAEAEVARLRSVVEDTLVALDESPKGVYLPPLTRNMAAASILIKSRAGADQ